MRKLTAKIALLLTLWAMIPQGAWAAIHGTADWDVRTTGSDTNGGCYDPLVGSPGTDYSQQDAAQIAYTDLVIGATNTQLTSAAHPFGASVVGNCINVTGGTGFTTGWYEILSVSGTTATMDRPVGTASSTGGTGNLGGGLATLTQANTNSVSGNQIWVKSATYTLTSTLSLKCVTFTGYTSSHGDFASATQASIETNRPLITTATNSTPLFTLGTNCGGTSTIGFEYLKLTNTAGTASNAVCDTAANNRVFADEVYFSGFTEVIAGDGSGTCTSAYNDVVVKRSEFTAFTVAAIRSHGAGAVIVTNSYIHDASTTGGIIANDSGNGAIVIIGNLFTNITPGGSNHAIIDALQTNGVVVSRNNTFYATTGASSNSIATTGAGILLDSQNDIFYSNVYHGIDLGGVVPLLSVLNSGFGNNGTDIYGNWYGGLVGNKITISVSPFTNTATNDYSLNSTAGGGAVCNQTGWPGVFPSQSSTGYISVGAVQPQAGASGGGTSGNYMCSQ